MAATAIPRDALPKRVPAHGFCGLDWEMRRRDVIARLKVAEPSLRRRGVGALYLFGSYGRDDAQSESDVDVFVDPAAEDRFGFLEFMGAYEAIQNAVGADVAIGDSTRDGLSPYARADIEREAVRIF
jgi:predicted nucleotidyltransferase